MLETEQHYFTLYLRTAAWSNQQHQTDEAPVHPLSTTSNDAQFNLAEFPDDNAEPSHTTYGCDLAPEN